MIPIDYTAFVVETATRTKGDPMKNKTYKLMANRTAADVVNNADVILKSNLTLEDAQRLSLSIQKSGDFIAVWIEEDEAPKTPRVVRTIEGNHNKTTCAVVRCDGWAI